MDWKIARRLAFIVAFGTSAFAGVSQAQLVLYDDFSNPRIDPAKWQGHEGPGRGKGGNAEAFRRIQNGQLQIILLSYGGTDTDAGRRNGRFGLEATNPELVTAMQAEVTVMRAVAQDCVANASSSRARAQLIGFFFNDGSSSGAEDRTGDVSANIQSVRDSKTGDRIEANMGRCLDPRCESGDDLAFFLFNSIWVLGQADTLRLEWDAAGEQFIYTVNPGSPVEELVALSYAGLVANAGPPDLDLKRFRINNSGANCTLGRKLAFMQALFDNVELNPEAVP